MQKFYIKITEVELFSNLKNCNPTFVKAYLLKVVLMFMINIKKVEMIWD